MKNISQEFSELYDKVLIQYQNNSARNQQFYNLSSNDEHYINILYELNKPTLTSFSRKAKISKPAATRIIQRFLNKGYIIKQPSSTDRRVTYLQLSQALQEFCKDNTNLFDQVFLQCISSLSEKELAELKYLITKVNKKL